MEIDELSIVVRGDISDVQEKLNKLSGMMKNLGHSIGGSASSNPMSKVTQSITRDTKKVVANLEEYKNKVKDLSKNWEFNGSIESARLYLKNFERQLQTAKEKLEDLEVDGKSGNSAWQTYTKTVARLTNKISILQKKLEETSVSMQDISQIPIQMYEDTFPEGYWDDNFGKDMENRTTTLSGEYTQPDVSALKEQEQIVEETNKKLEIQYKKHSVIKEIIRDIRTEVEIISSKFSAIKDKVSGALSKLKIFSKETKKSKKGASDLEKAFKKLTKSITRITKMLRLMITRMILRGLISNAQEGFKNLIQWSDKVNNSFSLLWNSFRQSGNSLSAMVAPLLNALAPAIDVIIQKFISATNAVNQFLSALTGQSTWIRAKKLTDSYRDSLNGASKAAQKSLAAFDKLNVLSSGSGGGSDTNYDDMFEEVELDSKFTGMLDGVKDKMSTLFEPIKNSWDKYGQPLIDSAKNSFLDVFNLVSSIGKSIGEVWTNGTGEETFDNILQIWTNILDIVGNVSEKFSEAWNTENIGTDTIQVIADIINDILSSINEITSATAEWASALNFEPFLSSMLGLWESIRGVVDLIYDSFVFLYEKAWLPIGKWALESALPSVIDLVSSALSVLTGIVRELQPYLSLIWENVISPIASGVGKVVTDLISGIASLLRQLWEDLLKPIISWASSNILPILEPIFETIKTYYNSAFESISSVINAVVGVLSGLITFLKGVFTGDINLILEGIKKQFSSVWNAISTIVRTSINLVFSIVKGVLQSVLSVVSSILRSIGLAIKNSLNIISANWRTIFNEMFNSVKNIFSGIWNFIKTTINSILGGIESMCNGVIKGVNTCIDALNGMSFDIPDWIPTIGGNRFGFNINKLSEISIPRLATGGFPKTGQLFIANEAGPEMVGKIGSSNAVVNEEQIVEGIKRGVKEALLESGGGNTTVVLEGDAKGLFKVVRKEANDYFDRNGESAFSY